MGTRVNAAEPAMYEIRVDDHLDERRADWVEGVAVTHEADGTTTLRALLPDQTALHGVLTRMRVPNRPEWP